MEVQATFIQLQKQEYHKEIEDKYDQSLSSGNSKVTCNISKGQIKVLKSVDVKENIIKICKLKFDRGTNI